MKVALVTSERFAGLTEDDALLPRSFAEHGIDASPQVWTDVAVEWSRFDCALVRSTWDYHLQPQRFSHWINCVSSQTRLVNAPELLHWNVHKSYLLELGRAGVPVVPTVVVPHQHPRAFDEVRELLGGEEFVIKPAVSASAYRTTILAHGHTAPADAQAHLDDLVRDRDALVQPFLREVYDPGERSLIFFRGGFSHAMWRPPFSRGAAAGERREHRIEPSDEERACAGAALEQLPSTPVYARVDLIPLRSGELAVAELELIEPALYFSACPSSTGALVDAIAAAAVR